MNLKNKIATRDEWEAVNSIVLFRKITVNSKKETIVNDLYFITSMKFLPLIIEAIDSRWEIENELHKHKDLLLEEDNVRFINPTINHNISILNNLALVFIKFVKSALDCGTTKFARKILIIDFWNLFFSTIHTLGSKKLIKEMIKNMKK